MFTMSGAADPIEDVLIVETPERVELHFPLASLGNRFLACAIDHTLQFLVLLATLAAGDYLDLIINSVDAGELDSLRGVSLWFKAFVTLFLFLLFFGYFVIFEAFWNGQTPGKRWLRLRVIQEDGRPATFFSIMARNVIRLADMMIPPFYSVGMVAIFASRHSKRLGDFVAHTVVVRESSAEPVRPDQFASPTLFPAPDEELPRVLFTGDVGQITPAEQMLIATCLRRSATLASAPREWLAWRVATPLIRKIKPVFERPDEQKGFSYEGFLRELLSKMNAGGEASRTRLTTQPTPPDTPSVSAPGGPGEEA